MRKELGVESAEETIALYHRVCSGNFGKNALPTDGKSEPSNKELVENNIDHYEATRFAGRESEIRELGNHVKSNRLVTIMGIGGVGKTRLVLEYTRRLLNQSIDDIDSREVGPTRFTDRIFLIH